MGCAGFGNRFGLRFERLCGPRATLPDLQREWSDVRYGDGVVDRLFIIMWLLSLVARTVIVESREIH